MIRALLILLISCHTVSASQADYQKYLAKLIPSVDKTAEQFRDLELNVEQENWLKQIDNELDTRDFPSYQSQLLISFDRYGYIDAVSIEELQEDKLEVFKDLIAKLLAIQVPELPKSIDPNTVFHLDTEFIFLDRKVGRLGNIASKKSEYKDLLIGLKPNQELELIEPNYIDYPQIGEFVVFKLEPDIYLNMQVIDLDKKSMSLKLASIQQASHRQYADLILRINRPEQDTKFTRIVSSGLASALGAGIASSSLSYGIVPGALALTAMTGTAMKQNQTTFNLSRGSKIGTKGLRIGEKQ